MLTKSAAFLGVVISASGIHANTTNIEPASCPIPPIQEKAKQQIYPIDLFASRTFSCDIYQHNACTMRTTGIVAGLLATLIPSVSATALTYKLDAHEKACFHADVTQTDVKVAFYFAVRAPLSRNSIESVSVMPIDGD
jgi:hypothetical protein